MIPNLTIIFFNLGWFNNQLVMGFFVRFTNLLHQPPLRRRPQQRILEKLARLATLAEVPMKAVTENELEHLGWSENGGGAKGGGFSMEVEAFLHEFFGKGFGVTL